MSEPAFWTGFVILLGGVAALVARSARIPAAALALTAGALFHQVIATTGRINTLPLGDHGMSLVGALAAAMLGFLIGAEIDPVLLIRNSRSIAVGTAAQAMAVSGAVYSAGLFLGFGRTDALTLAVFAIAASPVALAAVTNEERARGALTLRALPVSMLSLGIALIVRNVVSGENAPGTMSGWTALGGTLVFGCLGGLVLLFPLSRMGTRGATIAALGAGAFMMTALSNASGYGRGHLIVMTALAGLVMATFSATRTLIRETLRDLAFPCASVAFAIEGASLAMPPIRFLALGCVTLVAARCLGLWLSCAITRGPADAIGETAIMMPMGGMLLFLPGMALQADSVSDGRVAVTLIGAAFLSQVVGMPAACRALRRAGEAAQTDEALASWRVPT